MKIIKLSKTMKCYEYIAPFFSYLSYQTFSEVIYELLEKKTEEINSYTIESKLLRGITVHGNVSGKLIRLIVTMDKFFIDEDLEEFCIQINKLENSSLKSGIVKMEQKNFFKIMYSHFVTFYERYADDVRKKISYKYFYDFKTNRVYSNSWALAEAIRHTISHSEKFDYSDKNQPLIKKMNRNVVILQNSYFNFEFKDEYHNKNINELFSPVDLILLMLEMEKEI